MLPSHPPKPGDDPANPRRPFLHLAALGLLAAALVTVTPTKAAAGPASLWVDPHSRRGRCTDRLTRRQVSARRPLCSLAAAAALAVAGDTVRVARAVYRTTLAPRRSGTPRAPIRWVAEAGARIDAGGRGAGISVRGRHDLAFHGFTVTGARRQGVWVENAARVTFTALTARDNRGAGVQLRGTSMVTVRGASVVRNLGAGIQEVGRTRYSRVLDSRISGNGHARASFNGDGIQLAGHGAIVRGNTIEANGTHRTWEHGIYASAAASGYLIERNRLRGNAGANVKAQGSGTVRYNIMGGSRLAAFISGNSGQGVSVFYNVASGAYEDAVVVGGGGRARLWNNTLVNTSAGGTAQATALLVVNARAVDLRNNLLVTRAPDGRALAIPAPGQLEGAGALRADHNWYTTPDTAQPVVLGERSLSLDAWRAETGQDAATLLTPPPALTADARPAGDNPGEGAGMPLGFEVDVADEPVSPRAPSIGAYEG